MPAFNCFIYVIVLIYLNTEALSKATIVLLEVPFSLVDAVWYLYFLGDDCQDIVHKKNCHYIVQSKL